LKNANRAGLWVRTVGNANLAARSQLIGFRPAQADREAILAELAVLDIQRDEFRTAAGSCGQRNSGNVTEASSTACWLPSEATIRHLAEDLSQDPDVLLAMAGKVSADLREAICKRPQLFAALIRDLKELPDHAILKIVREVRDGKW